MPVDLEPGESYTGYETIELSPATIGNYVIVSAHYYHRNTVNPDPNYDNNQLSGPTNVTQRPSDLVVTAVNVTPADSSTNDFYSGGYLASGDDSYTTRDFDCLADFMGTSQDNLSAITGGNVNGGTTFFYYTDNSPLTESDIFALGVDYYNASGMYGLKEYLTWAGYDASTLYNQRIYGYDGIQEGFTYEQFKAEIDAGRPVLVHVKGHTMFGYGYGETDIPGSEYVYVNDTWTPGGWNPGFLYWGEGYPYWNGTAHIDLPMYGVTVMQVVPEPATIVLLSLGGLLFLRYKRIY